MGEFSEGTLAGRATARAGMWDVGVGHTSSRHPHADVPSKGGPKKLPGHNCNAPLHMATQFHQCKRGNIDKEGKPHESTVLNFTKDRIVYNEVRQHANFTL